MKTHKLPFRLAYGVLALSAGVVTHPISDWVIYSIALLISLIAVIICALRTLFPHTAWLFLFFGMLSAFLFGNGRYRLSADLLEGVENGYCTDFVQLDSRWTNAYGRYTAEVTTGDGRHWKAYSQRPDTTLEPGSVLHVSGYRSRFQAPVYPYQFDEETYYHSKGFSGKWYFDGLVLIRAQREPSLRNQIIDRIRSWPVRPATRAFYLAMITGEKGDIEAEDRAAFSRSGLVHILAVSGLHVGLIVAFVNGVFFFSVFRQTEWGRWMVWAISLIALWFFVYISGSSSSVLRAAIMFSAVATARALKRKAATPEAVWLSAYLLLLINPYEVYALGFQLSFAAVFSIVYGHAFVQNWMRERYGSLKKTKVLSLLSVSFWAQLGTSPITLYHFHQFPNFFLFSNVLFLPFVPILLGLGILLTIWSGWSIPPVWLFHLVDGAVNIFNYGVHWVSNLPGSVTEGIYLSKIQAWLCLSFVVVVIIAMYQRNLKAWGLGIILLSVLPFAREGKTDAYWVHHFRENTILEMEEANGVQLYMSDTTLQSAFFRQTKFWRFSRGVQSVSVSYWEFQPLEEGSENDYYAVSGDSILQQFRQSSP